MKFHKKHRIYGGVLVACASAFLIDRVFLAPRGAEAGELDAGLVVTAGVAAEAASHDAGESVVAQGALASRLEEIALAASFDPAAVPDAFRPSSSWTPQREAENREAKVASAAEMFKATHQLTAVMAATDGGIAIVDGQTLYIGQDLDGFRLIEVGHRSALFDAAGTRVELVVPDRQR